MAADPVIDPVRLYIFQLAFEGQYMLPVEVGTYVADLPDIN